MREAREARGYSQDLLAALCNVSKRTIQRAESGAPVALETASYIADALEAKAGRLHIQETRERNPSRSAERHDVVLLPTQSGKKIIEAIQRCDDTRIEYEVEPTHDNIEALSALSRRIKSSPSHSGLAPYEHAQLADAEVLRLMADLNHDLQQLHPLGIRVFLTAFTADRTDRRHDSYESGEIAGTGIERRDSPVEVVWVIVSDTAADHLVRRPGA